jgi:acyl-CoA thioesterase
MENIDQSIPESIRHRIREMNQVPIVIALGIKLISIDHEGTVRCAMDVSDKHNLIGSGHGGAVFTLADQAFALASNLGPEHQVAMFASINYIRAAKGRLEAVAHMVGETRSTSLYEVKVYEENELVAVFQGTGYKLRKRE